MCDVYLSTHTVAKQMSRWQLIEAMRWLLNKLCSPFSEHAVGVVLRWGIWNHGLAQTSAPRFGPRVLAVHGSDGNARGEVRP